MRIIEAPQLDVITPFPDSQQHRIWGWSKAFSNLTIADDGPQTKEEFDTYMQDYLGGKDLFSFGIIDRDNLLEMPHPAPLVGIIVFEQSGKYNGYFHVATSRSTWGTRMTDQAGAAIINDLFKRDPNLMRVSAAVNDSLAPAKMLLRRLGFKFEGLIRNSAPMGGKLQHMAHYGLTYDDWRYDPPQVVLRERKA